MRNENITPVPNIDLNMFSESGAKWKYTPNDQNETEEERKEKEKLRAIIRKNLINNLRHQIRTISLLFAYYKDKQEYLRTGVWPKTNLPKKNHYWAKYFFLQLTDDDVKLDKYFDFDYDTKVWTREKLIDLVLGSEIDSLIELSLFSQGNKSKPLSEYLKEKNDKKTEETKKLIRIKYDKDGNIEEFSLEDNETD